MKSININIMKIVEFFNVMFITGQFYKNIFVNSSTKRLEVNVFPLKYTEHHSNIIVKLCWRI